MTSKDFNTKAQRDKGHKENDERLSYLVIGAAIEVHKTLCGPGLLESVYEEAMYEELRLRNIPFVKQQEVPLFYKGNQLDKVLKLDLLIGERVVIELKAVEKILPVHSSQLLTYLRLTGLHLGLVINFGQSCLKEGVSRVINGYL